MNKEMCLTKKRISHQQRTKFEEERARLVLALKYPERYSTTVLSEAPDIITDDGRIGVEVTSCTKQSVQEDMSYVSRVSAGKKEIKRSKKNRNNNIVEVMSSTRIPVVGFCVWGETYDWVGVYQKKINKLNQKHFQKFEENNLFIFAWMADREELTAGIQHLLEYIKRDDYREYIYDYIYLFNGTILANIVTNSMSCH